MILHTVGSCVELVHCSEILRVRFMERDRHTYGDVHENDLFQIKPMHSVPGDACHHLVREGPADYGRATGANLR